MKTHSDLARHRPRTSWEIVPVTREEVAEIKRLFLKLHLYNANLDPRFALAEDWERHFTALIERALIGQDQLALLAWDQGRPAGFLLAAVHRDFPMWRHHEWAEVEALYVERLWRGTGLADALLGRAFDWAAALGLPAVQLYVTASNTRAVRFYERQGFRPAQAVMRTLVPLVQNQAALLEARAAHARPQSEARRRTPSRRTVRRLKPLRILRKEPSQ
jgi:GNAT superfamily N-acetyltransferase